MHAAPSGSFEANPMMEKSASQRDRYRLMLWLSLVLVAITWVAFAPTLKNDFVNFDDDAFITHNRHLKAGLTARGIWWALTDQHPGCWHPLTDLSFLVDFQLYGLDPTGFHLTNLMLHA